MLDLLMFWGIVAGTWITGICFTFMVGFVVIWPVAYVNKWMSYEIAEKISGLGTVVDWTMIPLGSYLAINWVKFGVLWP